MFRKAALLAYTMGALLAVCLSVAGIRAVLEAGVPMKLSALVATFLPMLALVAAVFLAQLRSSRFLPVLAVGLVISAGLALFSLLNHGFPEVNRNFAALHLLSVVAVGVLAVHHSRGKHSGSTKTAL
jgi:hypothetical protein